MNEQCSGEEFNAKLNRVMTLTAGEEEQLKRIYARLDWVNDLVPDFFEKNDVPIILTYKENPFSLVDTDHDQAFQMGCRLQHAVDGLLDGSLNRDEFLSIIAVIEEGGYPCCSERGKHAMSYIQGLVFKKLKRDGDALLKILMDDWYDYGYDPDLWEVAEKPEVRGKMF